MHHPKASVRLATLTALLWLGGAAAAHAQTRDQLIRDAFAAYDSFESERALGLLRSGLNPALGPPDSLWAQGVHLLAQIHIEEGRDAVARVWQRWAVRLRPELRLDSITFLPDVVDGFRAARDYVASRAPADSVTTTWEWPAGVARTNEGALRVVAERLPVPLEVQVAGVGILDAGQDVTLPAGSYDILTAADGYQNARVAREVLPGITTVVRVRLLAAGVAAAADSVLPESVETEVREATALLTVQRFGAPPACAAGVLIGRDGLLLTSYQAIRGASSVAVDLADGTSIGDAVRVAAYDVDDDVAILVLPSAPDDSLAPASPEDVTDGQFAWSVHFPDCGSATELERTTVTAWTDRPTGALELADAPDGAAVVDRSGRLVGIATEPAGAVPAARATAYLGRAERNRRLNQVLTAGELARIENHIFGSVALSTNVAGASARITPLETWHWAELAQTAELPSTFVGPMGRYRLELVVDGQVQRQLEFTVRPATEERLVVTPEDTPQPEQVQLGQDEGGGFPVAVAVLLGLAGAGGAAFAVLGGGGGGDGDTGTIRIRIPINP